MSMGDARDRRGAAVLGVHLPRGAGGEVFLCGFREPRTTSVIPLGAAAPEAVALAIASSGRRDVTVVLDRPGKRAPSAEAATIAGETDRMLPGAEVLVCDPDRVLGFLWYFRDHYDPLTLGHSSDRTFPAFRPEATGLPSHRRSGGRAGSRRALLEIRELLLTMGNALGIRPPIPSPDGGTPGWGARRISGLMDAVAVLAAGLLYRWGSPLVRTARREDGTEIEVAGG